MILDFLPIDSFDQVLAIKLLALPIRRYAMTLVIAAAAFGAATNVESVVWRTLALVYLGLNGLVFLLMGLVSFAVIDILLGLAGLGAAFYAWHYTRV